MFGGMAYKIGILAKKSTGGGAGDVVPNAINWSSAEANNLAGEYIYTEKQITGINQTITLRVQYTSGLFQLYRGVNIPEGGLRGVYGDLEGTASMFPPSDFGLVPINHNGTFTVNNNDWIAFGVDYVGAGSSGPTTVTVQNESDSYTTLDTFPVYITELL